MEPQFEIKFTLLYAFSPHSLPPERGGQSERPNDVKIGAKTQTRTHPQHVSLIICVFFLFLLSLSVAISFSLAFEPSGPS